MLKSYWWGGWGGGPCDYCVSPSPFALDFGTLDFGLWDFGLGLDNKYYRKLLKHSFIELSSVRQEFSSRCLLSQVYILIWSGALIGCLLSIVHTESRLLIGQDAPLCIVTACSALLLVQRATQRGRGWRQRHTSRKASGLRANICQ